MNLPLNVNISIIIISLSSLATLVKVMMALATYASYVVMFDIPLDIINSYIQERISPDKHLKAEYLLRLGLVLFTFSLASSVPRLDLFISLVCFIIIFDIIPSSSTEGYLFPNPKIIP